jgi:hypothetical protein
MVGVIFSNPIYMSKLTLMYFTSWVKSVLHNMYSYISIVHLIVGNLRKLKTFLPLTV